MTDGPAAALDLFERDGDPAPTGRGRRRAGSQKPRPRTSPISAVGVLGELLITAGVLVFAFLGWQVWLGDLLRGNQLNAEAEQLVEEWGVPVVPQPPDVGEFDPEPVASLEAPVAAAPANAVRFANLIIPRFGVDYRRPIAEGIGTTDVLNRGNIGHYPATQMPGDPGNFALASHRSSGGGNFHDLHQLRAGDHIYVETEAGWYRYTFRNIEYVRPTGVGVLNPIPQIAGAAAAEQYITLTTCNPFFSTAERLIAYGVFDGFYDRTDGPPTEIAQTVGAT